MDAAQRTAWPPKVYALGRVLAAGLIASDEAEVDVQDQALAAMADLERLHIILLELLVKYEPDWTGERYVAVPHRVPSYQDTFFGGSRPDNPRCGRSAAGNGWPARLSRRVLSFAQS